jgi:hypothetical protein
MESVDGKIGVMWRVVRMKVTLILWVVFVCSTFFAVGQTQPLLKFDNGVIYVFGLRSTNTVPTAIVANDQWNKLLSVYTHEAFLKKIDQPVAGKYKWNGNVLLFRPAFPFAPGETYHAVLTLSAFSKNAGMGNVSLPDTTELTFSIAADNYPRTTVESIYPESATLPENLLKMYIYFSAPMMPGEAYEHISLTKEDGTKVEKTFLVVDQELWDSGRKRLTLLFDPGRIKRDLKSNIDLGMPLQQGEKYHLVIDSTWRDVHGNALEKTVTKTFSVTWAERTKVSPRHWKVVPPIAGSLGDVVISFDRPMDHALALKHIAIRNPSGFVSGHVETVDDFIWKFTPEHPWLEGEYVIEISPLLEDVAGNNLNNVFDLDLSKERRVNSVEPVVLPLTITLLDH